jgi:hypothetical protein
MKEKVTVLDALEKLSSSITVEEITSKHQPPDIPFTTLDWIQVPEASHVGHSGNAHWRTIQFPGIRLRMVEYSAGYLADHWCSKGHIVHCLEGEFTSELQTGERITLSAGISYIVSDEMSMHRSLTEKGVKLMIIDGDF